MTDPFLTPQEAADIHGVSDDFIRKQCRDGKLAHYRIGKHFRIKRTDLDRFIESTRVEAVTPKQRVQPLSKADRDKMLDAVGLKGFKPRKGTRTAAPE